MSYDSLLSFGLTLITSLQFSNSLNDGIAVAERLFTELNSQARRIGRSHITVNRNRDILDEVQVQIIIKMIHAFHDVKVGEGGGRMDRGEPQDGTAARVRRGGN